MRKVVGDGEPVARGDGGEPVGPGGAVVVRRGSGRFRLGARRGLDVRDEPARGPGQAEDEGKAAGVGRQSAPAVRHLARHLRPHMSNGGPGPASLPLPRRTTGGYLGLGGGGGGEGPGGSCSGSDRVPSLAVRSLATLVSRPRPRPPRPGRRPRRPADARPLRACLARPPDHRGRRHAARARAPGATDSEAVYVHGGPAREPTGPGEPVRGSQCRGSRARGSQCRGSGCGGVAAGGAAWGGVRPGSRGRSGGLRPGQFQPRPAGQAEHRGPFAVGDRLQRPGGQHPGVRPGRRSAPGLACGPVSPSRTTRPGGSSTMAVVPPKGESAARP